eukprot:458711-Pyramimonas_sp.AAC.1
MCVYMCRGGRAHLLRLRGVRGACFGGEGGGVPENALPRVHGGGPAGPRAVPGQHDAKRGRPAGGTRPVAARDWSVGRIYLRFLRPSGPSLEYTCASCV